MTSYSYEPVKASEGTHFRVRDSDDNRIATCYSETNARLVVMALGFAAGDPVEWICGHQAGACCATCHAELAQKAHELAEENLEFRAR